MYIRLRYPLLLVLGTMVGLMVYDQDRDHPVNIQPPPNLQPGYYVVLHTKAKLPEEIPALTTKERTYIGPLPHVKSCHEHRVKVRPIHPGVETELLKINDLSD